MSDYDLTGKVDYPLMSMPKQECQASVYNKKCANLRDCIKHVCHYFLWYSNAPKKLNDELRATIYLDGQFLQILTIMHEIYILRDGMLLCQNTDMFKELLLFAKNKISMGVDYIRDSGKKLSDEMEKETKWIVDGRRDIVDGFKSLAEWLQHETNDAQKRKSAKSIVNKLNICYYDMSMFGCIGDSFEQHANMVFNGALLLACPAPLTEDTKEQNKIFDDAIAELKKGIPWKRQFETWKQEIVDEYVIRGIGENNEAKVEFLKNLWGKLKDRKKSLLREHGIEYSNINCEIGKSIMCKNLYDNINGNTAQGATRMSTTDLQQYFSYVTQKQYLDAEIKRLKPKPLLFDEAEPPSKERKIRPIFKKKVDLDLLIDCFNKVYNQFYVNCCTTLYGGNKDLMVYLYIICEEEKYCKNAPITPFFRFCTLDCGFQTEVKTSRTFYNHLKAMEGFNPETYRHSSRKMDKDIYNDYMNVRRIFQGTENYLNIIKP